MRMDISHTTRFDYDGEVQPGPHLVYLRPRENPLLRVDHFQLDVTPGAHVYWTRDDLDNLPASIQFSTATTAIEIQSTCSVVTSEIPPLDFLVRDYANAFPFAYEPLHGLNLGVYLAAPERSVQQALKTWLANRIPRQPRETVAWLCAVNELLCANLRYQRRDVPGIQRPLLTLELGTGSCRDYAVLLIEIARTVGIAARFVSGYLFDALQQESSAGDMHAWVEVYLPGAGWRALDPTHGIFCTSSYVPVAHAAVAESVNPVQGSFFSEKPARARMTTRVQVRPNGAERLGSLGVL